MFNNAEVLIFADSISPISPLVEETIDKSPYEKNELSLHALKLKHNGWFDWPEDLINRNRKVWRHCNYISDLDVA